MTTTTVLWAATVALLASVPVVHAATPDCRQLVAGESYACTLVTASKAQPFKLTFDATGRTAQGLASDFSCFCSSTGSKLEALENEAGRGITCIDTISDTVAIVLSARATGRKLTQGSIAQILSTGADASLLDCNRID